MSDFFNNVLNVLIRGLPFPVRGIIAFVFFFVAVLCFKKSLNIKGENLSAINWGWFILFGLLSSISVVYIAV